jgi:CheY-like chemotaxis protein
MDTVLTAFAKPVTGTVTAGLKAARHGLNCALRQIGGSIWLAGKLFPGKRPLSEVSKSPTETDPPAIARPLKAVLLRVGTVERMALAEVLEIIPTQTAEAALSALADFAADVVVTDIGTSDRETTALLKRLRDPVTSPRRGLPVICLLAESSPAQVHGLIKAGVDHVMIKPISATALYDLARHLCDNPMPQISVPKYIGPDRRRLPDDSFTGPNRRAA